MLDMINVVEEECGGKGQEETVGGERGWNGSESGICADGNYCVVEGSKFGGAERVARGWWFDSFVDST